MAGRTLRSAGAAMRPASASSPNPKPQIASSHGDALRAAFYAVQMMSEDAAQRRFAELVAKEYLLCDEADECQMLADRLKVRLAWTHFDLMAGVWGEGRGRWG